MNQFITVNSNTCIGCGTCLLGCSEAHARVGKQDQPRLHLVKTRDVSASVACHHCMGAPCAKVCPVNAIRQREDGCIVVDEKTCVGCKLCAIACPFGAVHMSGTSIAGVVGTEYPTPTFVASLSPILQWEIGVYACAVKCDLCSFKEEGPSCVSVCPTRSIRLIDEGSMEKISAEKHKRAAVLGDFVADPYVLRST
jgi:hydrogenase-4 component A